MTLKVCISFQTDDGSIRREEEGSVGDKGGVVKSGNWAWVSPKGDTFSVQFTADENGYRPVGDHLPTPPPLPEALQRFYDARAAAKRRPKAVKVLKKRKRLLRKAKSSTSHEKDSQRSTKIQFKKPLSKMGTKIAFRRIV